MLRDKLQEIIKSNPDYAQIIPVIEKEILHHDIFDVLVQQGAMQSLTFIGGTSLRMCYNSARLSEDLDFNSHLGFRPSSFDGLEVEIQNYLQKKYDTEVWVNKPSENMQGNTASWKISIEKVAHRPDLPRQKLHIDVCAIPSFDIEKRPLINHYPIVVPTDGLLIPVQSLQETLADKFIALAYRSRRIKPRDIWDITWIKQRGVELNPKWIENKLSAREKTQDDFLKSLNLQLEKLTNDKNIKQDFNNEISRFIPLQIKQRTIDNPDYWPYVQTEIKMLAEKLFTKKTHIKFDMG